MYEKQSKCSVFYFLPKTVQRICRPAQNRLPRDYIYKENYKTKYLRLFTLCSYLITKESYDRWIIRRKWEFRHQISEAKYLKMSVTDIKYLKQNISKCRSHISGSFRRTPQHCAKWLRNSPGMLLEDPDISNRGS